MTEYLKQNLKSRDDVSAKMLADFLWNKIEGRNATDKVIEVVEANFASFDFVIEESYLDKKNKLEMSRAQLSANADVLRNLLS